MSHLRQSALFILTAAVLLWHGLETMPQRAAAAEPPAKPTKEDIAKWVRQLGDDDFSAREEASKKLYEASQAAEEAVQEATRSDDAEVARRATDIMDKFKWGLYPDAPQKVVDLVKRYRAADPAGKQIIVQEMLKAGPSGYRTLLKIAGAEPDPNMRGLVLGVVSTELSHAAPQKLADGDDASLELLLDVLLADDAAQGAPHYAAYWMMRGKLDDRIAHFKALAAKGMDSPRNWEIVAHLCHAKGDLAAAAAAADKAEKPELADAMLFEAGDWKSLAARPVHGDTDLRYEVLALDATYKRRAGDAKGFDDGLAELRKLADAAPIEEIRFQLAKLLFFNDRPNDGVAVLMDTPGRQVFAFEMLAAQMRYKEAFALAEKARLGKSPEMPALEILQARTLYALSEKDKALAIFKQYGDQIKDGADASWFETLIESEMKVGLKDQAFEHAAKVLAASKDEGWKHRLFARLFPKNGDAAEGLWQLLQQRPNWTPAANMKDLRRMLDGTADPKVLRDVVEAADWAPHRAMGSTVNLSDVPKWVRGAAEAALACRDEKLASSLLETAGEKWGSADALIKLGDLDADKKEWDKAEQSYAKAWAKSHDHPLALFLDGWSLEKAGKAEEGKKRMELAHWTPLGDADARKALLKGLAERGLRDAVHREGELLLRLSPAGSFHAAEGLRQVGLDAMDRKDYAAAADGQERSMLRCLNRDVNYVQPVAYLAVPALVQRLRALAFTAAGKIDEAQKETELGLAALPGDTFLPIELIPAWEKAGHKKEAQELFDRCLAAQEKVCTEYPNCAWAQNSVAWLSACCRRNLESAEKHALKATELSPSSAGGFDTLAEVYFQRGDKEKAIATQKKAIELDPKKAYYRKQLKRIEAGDPAADRPAESEDDD